jgi:hypothetical protein
VWQAAFMTASVAVGAARRRWRLFRRQPAPPDCLWAWRPGSIVGDLSPRTWLERPGAATFFGAPVKGGPRVVACEETPGFYQDTALRVLGRTPRPLGRVGRWALAQYVALRQRPLLRRVWPYRPPLVVLSGPLVGRVGIDTLAANLAAAEREIRAAGAVGFWLDSLTFWRTGAALRERARRGSWPSRAARTGGYR